MVETQEPLSAEDSENRTYTVSFKYENGQYVIKNKTGFDIEEEDPDLNDYVKFNDNTLNITIENVKKPYLTIEKLFINEDDVDITESIINSDLINKVKFEITVKTATANINGIHVNDGETITVSLEKGNNKIQIDNIIPTGKQKFAYFTIKEISTIDGFIKMPTITFSIRVDDDGEWKINEPNNVDFIPSEDGKLIKLKNHEEPTEQDINLNVLKQSNSDKLLKDVPFTVSMQVGGTYLKDSNGVEYTENLYLREDSTFLLDINSFGVIKYFYLIFTIYYFTYK